MRVEDLQLAEDGMREKHADRGFANEPITSKDVQRGPCERVRMGRCAYNRKAGEKCETRPEGSPTRSG